jgi:hypothetical protein
MSDSNTQKFTAALGKGADCPAIDDLTMLLEGAEGEKARIDAEKHIACCAHCQSELALLQQFTSPIVRSDEQADVNFIVKRLRQNSPAPAPDPWWKQIWNPRILVPASLALTAAALILILVFPQRPHSGGPMGPIGEEVQRSGSIEAVAPLNDVNQAPTVIVWRPAPGATRYTIHLSEVDRTELWSATAPGPIIEIPANIRARIVPGKTLFWSVTSDTGASSGLQRFRVEGNPTR